MDHLSSESLTSRRPTVFRALGTKDPPPVVSINGRAYRWSATLKHNSWAATARAAQRRSPRVDREAAVKPSLNVSDGFFPELRDMLAALHSRGIAYFDMSTWGNLLVGEDGRPYLIDCQIYFRPGQKLRFRWLSHMAQAADVYYLRYHWRRCRPDPVPPGQLKAWSREPSHVWIAERAWLTFHLLRILVLRLYGVQGNPRRETVQALGERRPHDAPGKN